MKTFGTRKAAGLLELVVVLGILAILMSLLLPAVQAAREGARRTLCQNRLRQIGLAAHAHETTHGHLPTGGWGWRWTGEPDRGFGPAQPGGWIYNLLPFLEAESLRAVGNGQSGNDRAQVLAASAMLPVEVFTCPSRRSAAGLPFVHPVDYVNMTRPELLARGDYAACSGDVAPDVSDGRGRGPASLAEGDSPQFVWNETNRTGVVFRRSRVTLASIRDGLSNTYLTGEKYVNDSDHLTGKAENDDQHLLVGYDSDTLRITDHYFPPLRDAVDVPSDHSFGSSHPSGFQMAMGDGSVTIISYDIDLEVHRTHGNRRDGLPTPVR